MHVPVARFPCKHGLALMLICAQNDTDFTPAAVSDWVTEWLGRRRKTAAPTPARNRPTPHHPPNTASPNVSSTGTAPSRTNPTSFESPLRRKPHLPHNGLIGGGAAQRSQAGIDFYVLHASVAQFIGAL